MYPQSDVPPSTMPVTAAKEVSSGGEKDGSVLHCVDDVVELSPAKRGKLLRKLDWHLLPLISLLYLLSFLDRSNVGNAYVLGMSHDLNLVGLRYNIAAAVFFIPYSFGEVPSNIVLKLVRPSRWLPTIMIAWGIVMTLMCLVNSYQGLLVSRFFLGITEAGLFPGMNYYLSLWYPRVDRARRIALFFSAVTLAGAFGGLLAYGINHMDGIGGLHGWQWIFCLEGLATIVVAVGAAFFMYDYPETASFLTGTERRSIVELMKNDSQNLSTRFDFKFVLQAFQDYKTYIQVGIYLGLLIPGYALILFIPTIINELGFSATNAQLLSVPVFVIGCISTLFSGVYSDMLKLRGPFVIVGGIVSLVGYIVLYTQTGPGASYVGALIASAGAFGPVPAVLAWISSNAGGDTKRSVVLALVLGMGSLGGICSSFVYLDPPHFHIGHGTIMGWLGFAVLLSAFAMWDYDRINKQREELCQKRGITEDQRDLFQDMGDESPLFRYAI